MTEDSIRRGVATLLGTIVVFLGHKLGLSDQLVIAAVGLCGGYVAQSAAKAIVVELSKHKSLAVVVDQLAKLQAAATEAKADVAQAEGAVAGQAAAAAPAAPGSPASA